MIVLRTLRLCVSVPIIFSMLSDNRTIYSGFEPCSGQLNCIRSTQDYLKLTIP